MRTAMNRAGNSIEIDGRKLLKACLRKWWLIVLCGVLAAGAALFWAKCFVTPMYRASVTIYVSNMRNGEDVNAISGSDLSASRQLVDTYVSLIKSDAVLAKVVEKGELACSPADLRGAMSAEQVLDTELFTVSISHEDPEMAARIANAVAEVAPGEIGAFAVGSSAKIVDYAAVPGSYYEPNYKERAILGGMVGCLIALVIIAALYLMDTRGKDIQVEDLLDRKPVKLDQAVLDRFLKGKTILVTGGGGSIGSELCRQIARCGPGRLIVLDIYENNAYDIQQELQRIWGERLDLQVVIASVRDKERIYDIFDHYRPEIVFHAAAHKHVPLMEECPEEAIKNNVFGTYHVVRAAEKYGTKKFVMISTDKAVNPTNFMGATKRFCEMILQSRSDSPTEFCAVRFGNVLGSNGSVVPLFQRQIEAGGPVTVTDKRVIRYFMTIPEAAQLVLEAGAMAGQSQIFVLDMGEPVKILTLAENLIRLSGLEPYRDIEIREVGLRPGEKLYEELLMDSENLVQTANEKIFIEQQREIDRDKITESLVRLDDAIAGKMPSEELVELMKQMIPTYHSPDEVNR